MQIEIQKLTELDVIRTECLIIGMHEKGTLQGTLSQFNRSLGGVLQAPLSLGDFSGKKGQLHVIVTGSRAKAKRILLVGLGPKKGWTREKLQNAVGCAIGRLGVIQCREASIWIESVSGSLSLDQVADAVSEAVILRAYRFDKYRSQGSCHKVQVKKLTFWVRQGASARLQNALKRGISVAQAVNRARDLITEPSSVVTPEALAKSALEIARKYRLRSEVWGSAKIRSQGMRALAAVGQGSQNAPRFIQLDYRPKKTHSKAPIVIVGKGVTFDSGGISLKPSLGMEMMKYDMSGAAAVLGTLEACAALKLPHRVVGLIPSAENMPDGNAYKPGDVIKTHAGKTVEINNTDAEGRLLLADALSFAKQLKPRFVIDLATLTGACLVAIGPLAMLGMGNDERLMKRLQKAGEYTGERVWPLPLWDEYFQFMKSPIADMKNAGGRDAGSITAGIFLKQFVDYPWVHLDIASTAWLERPLPYMEKGARGVGVRLLVEMISGLNR
jgi:leucyl aminopeptidase